VQVRDVDYFNYDTRCHELNGSKSHDVPSEVREEAGKQFKEFIDSHFKTKKSFAFETTLRTDKELHQVREARELGFKTQIIFVCTDNVEKNIERVKGRYYDGFHAGSERYIRETYDKALKNLSDICKEVDGVIAFDNSGNSISRVFQIEQGKLVNLDPEAPAWAIESLERAGLVQGKDFHKFEISVLSKEDFKRYSHHVYVSKNSFQTLSTREKEVHLHKEATKFIDQHPVLSRQDTGKFEISIRPAVKDLAKDKGLGLSK